MKHPAAKRFFVLCGLVVMLALVASIASIPAFAAENGIYVATATPHYRHPVTGVIEDAGGDGSAVLGQSMTESALYRQALVEVDADGNTYVTIRLKLMDNISGPQFQVDGYSVSASLMQEDYSANTADYRMAVGSEYSVIRCNMYVIPMGREVIFYITVSGLEAGSGDFITSVTVTEPTEAPTEPETTAATEAPAGTEAPTQETAAPTETTAPAATTAPTETTVPPTTRPADTSQPTESTAASGLQEFDASGNRVQEETPTETAQSGGSSTGWILGGIVIVLILGGCLWYFGIARKKK